MEDPVHKYIMVKIQKINKQKILSFSMFVFMMYCHCFIKSFKFVLYIGDFEKFYNLSAKNSKFRELSTVFTK